VAIARALVNQPLLLLADEPTGNLDTQTSQDVMGVFTRLNREQGITVLLVTHEPDIAQYAQRLIKFRDGHVIYDGPPSAAH
jgi:putative ABC transport system ATP-binding protein